MNTKKIGAIISGVAIVAGLGLGITGIEKIAPGYVGVVYSVNGGVQDDILTQGWKWVGPGKKVIKYSVATEQMYLSADEKAGSKDDDSFDVICKDGKLNVDFEMSYSFNAEDTPGIVTRYRGLEGEDIINTIVRGKIKTFVNEVTSQYTVLEAHMEKKAELNRAITEHLRESLKPYGVNVESANLTRTSADKSVEEAITRRSAAAQELEAETLKQQQAQKEAETKKIKAQGEADAALIKAQGEAEANRVLSESLTSELIQMMEIEKWNGSKATTVVNDANSTVVTPAQ